MSLWRRNNTWIGGLVMALVLLLALGFSMYRTFLTQEGADQEGVLRSFYYPLQAWDEPMVYVYTPEQAELGVDIWVHQKDIRNGDTILVSKAYDSRHLLQAIQIEKWVDNGVLLESLQLFDYDSLMTPTITEAEIIHGNQFSWDLLEDEHRLLSQLRYYDPFDATIVNTLTRNRSLDVIRDAADTQELQLQLHEHIESKQVGSIDISYQGVEIYTSGIGKTYYRKSLQDDMTLEYSLTERLPLKKFEQLYGPLVDPFKPTLLGS